MTPGTVVTIQATGRTGTITGHLADPYGGTYAVVVDGKRGWYRERELRAEENK